jgi:signal peptidase I
LSKELRIIRTLYWTLWFVVVPLCLALIFVWGLTPPSGVDQAGFWGWIESAVREQPVPVAIVAFTLFEMALWAARHELPFARHALPPLRAGIPETLRGPFERARTLLDEADGILAKHEKAVVRDLSAKEREQLKGGLDDLRAAMDTSPFDEETFYDSLVKADGEVDVRLRPWRKSELREYLESILVAIAVALALRAFVVEAFKIPSGSMIPTLQVGDHIFVNKFIFGPAIPWTHARVWTRMPPKRGDVIVHAFPEHPEQDFIKRVIAIPGDKLEARNGHPWINGWEVPSCSVGLYSYTQARGRPLRRVPGRRGLPNALRPRDGGLPRIPRPVSREAGGSLGHGGQPEQQPRLAHVVGWPRRWRSLREHQGARALRMAERARRKD